MTITIHLTTDNAAFDDDRDRELARLVQKVADGFRDSFREGREFDVFVLFDSNGNSVGTVSITET